MTTPEHSLPRHVRDIENGGAGTGEQYYTVAQAARLLQVKESPHATILTQPRSAPLTQAEVQRRLAALARLEAPAATLRQSRGGMQMLSSVEWLRQARDDLTRRL